MLRCLVIVLATLFGAIGCHRGTVRLNSPDEDDIVEQVVRFHRIGSLGKTRFLCIEDRGSDPSDAVMERFGAQSLIRRKSDCRFDRASSPVPAFTVSIDELRFEEGGGHVLVHAWTWRHHCSDRQEERFRFVRSEGTWTVLDWGRSMANTICKDDMLRY